MKKAEPDAVKSADRVLDLLECLSRLQRPAQQGELADILEIPKSSLSKLLRNLQDRDYVSQESGGYVLGASVRKLAKEAGQVQDLLAVSTPYLEEITAQLHETSALNRLRGDGAEVIATVNGPQRLGTHMHLGDVAPLYATSGGKAILAFMPSDWQADYLQRVKFIAQTGNTVTSRETLQDQIEQTVRRQIAYSFDEWTLGVTGIAKPILSKAGLALGSINVAIPSARYSPILEAAVIEALTRAVRLIERQIELKA